VVRILVISDTHIQRSEDMPTQILEIAKHADMVIHAGDVTRDSVLLGFEKNCEVVAVRGNMDAQPVSSRFPAKTRLDAEGVRIGVVHGFGAPDHVAYIARNMFEDVDIIIFGHSHQFYLESLEGVTMMNPGSPTDPRRAPFPSYGWIEINGAHYKAELFALNGELEKSLTR
jgi:uncharacterized protein